MLPALGDCSHGVGRQHPAGPNEVHRQHVMSTHGQPSRKVKEQKLLEEGKMNQQEIQALEKKLKKK